MGKKWYESKTMWVNIVATVGIIVQTVTGDDIFKPEYQVLALSVLNVVLRTITKENINWWIKKELKYLFTNLFYYKPIKIGSS